MNDNTIPDHLDISLDELLNIRAPGTYLVKVAGDSMEGAGIFSGDMLIVNKGPDPKAGQVIIGVVNQEPLVKYLAFVGCHTVLRSANRKYPDRFIMEGDDFDVWGVVTHSIRDHWRN
ncbi:LexA family protein [Pseudomonas syringae]|uniref:Error-prone repair protein UmuD n=1 Tax=Pseudomonas syringae pv. actinidiae TaxID=103796 RepID=A0A286JZY5_PSESF|nr:S24 family peptidase [Pseudomonas syringae]AMW88359.1 Error-prone repair protein UmuD [Pseudomonas syringae pv. actinidiae]OKS58508.1 peptidase S24 [Pseudomonas syringae pv. actinidiae]OKS79672.1 peptidase S24 [Pseudomonas syringae pv. actinidiae]OSO70525.1 LexA repressor [Pseudomonas syringae pv. actinidiae]